MGRFLRVLIGFAVACLAAAYTKLLFAVTPAELAALPSDLAADRLAEIADKGWKFAVLFGLFALPFAIVALAVGEGLGVRNWTYYTLVALGIALVGFIAQWQSEAPNAAYTVVANYSLIAYLTTGFMAGLFYWLFSGRVAGVPAMPQPVDMSDGATGGKGDMAPRASASSTAKTEVVTAKPTAASVAKTQVMADPEKAGKGGKSEKKGDADKTMRPGSATPATGMGGTKKP